MTDAARTRGRKIAIFFAVLMVLYIAAGVLLCEGALYVHHAAASAPAVPPHITDADCPANGRAVQITAGDGAVLRGWLIAPAASNGAAILMLHGIGDTRKSGVPFARVFVAHGYTILMPDIRGHGESGGKLVTYGLREAEDVRLWIDWLAVNERPRRIYGLGESLGAAVLLQALPAEPRLRAVVAECPFASLEEIARDRVAQRVPLRASVGRLVAWPAVQFAFIYARLKYGLDFRDASPEAAVRHTATPILLIHGLEDRNTDPAHSRAIAARNPRIVLWLVPHAGHTGAYGTAPDEFTERVLGWFSDHP